MDLTRVYIDTKALKGNISLIQKHIGTDKSLIAMVKANAYGHDMVPAAHAALEAGVAMLAVARVDEGAALREAGITCPILVAGGVLEDQAEEIVENSLTQAVYSPALLYALNKAAAHVGRTADIHIKIDTGMKRVGVDTDAGLDSLLSLLPSYANVRFSGMYTHFATADDPGNPFTGVQYARFCDAAAKAHAAGYKPLLHAHNSAAMILLEYPMFDAGRLGVTMYGMSPSGAVHMEGIKSVLSLKSRIVAINHLQPGESVSYSRRFVADRPSLIATLPIGYADGYRRELTNKADVLVHGMRARVCGTVCMDHVMVDITDIPGAAVGDEAVLIGSQGEDTVTADELAAICGTINYEITSCIGRRIPRVYE